MSSGIVRDLVMVEKYRLGVRPRRISDVVYRWNLRDFVRFAGRGCGAATCIGVSDLVYCSQKYWLRQEYPELILGDNLYAAWASYGRLIHRGLQDLLEEYGFKSEIEVEKILRINDGYVGVTGRLDALGLWNDKKTVVEIKSGRSDVDLPKPPHVLQLRIYMNLARAEQGILLYVTPDRVTDYVFDTPLSDAELEILVKETLENTRHPRYPWECQYCPFSIMCPYKVSNNNRYHKR